MIRRVFFSLSSVSLFSLVLGNTSSDFTFVSILTLLSLILNLFIPPIIANPIENLSVGKGSS